MVGRGRLLVVNHGEHHRWRLQKRNMAAPLHSHFSNDTLRFQEDHLFSRTGQAFFLLRFFPFFLSLFRFFFFGTRLLRGGLQLLDISENPNNDRIDGDPPTHPPNPNKCLMPDVTYIGRYTQPLLFMECGCFEKRILSA